MQKYFWLFFILGFLLSCQKELASNTWSEDWVSVTTLAQETQKPILINFTGSDWCVWCKRLDKEVFSQKTFQQYAQDNLILFKADFPSKIPQSKEIKDQNASLQKKYKIKGYPTIMLVNAEGEVIARTGYQKGGASAYVRHLESLLTK